MNHRLKTDSAPRDILVQEDEIREAWMPDLEERNCEDADNVDENIEIEEEDWELDLERAEATEYPTQEFDTAQRYKDDRS